MSYGFRLVLLYFFELRNPLRKFMASKMMSHHLASSPISTHNSLGRRITVTAVSTAARKSKHNHQELVYGARVRLHVVLPAEALLS